MKKQLSLGMAAAMTFGTVVPAFATSSDVVAESNTITVDARLAQGKEIYTDETGRQVFKRHEVFNYNGAQSYDTEKHTLKSTFKDCEVLIEQEDATDAGNDLIVLAKKVADDKEISSIKEKANYDAALKTIESLETNGYVITQLTTKATLSTTTQTVGDASVTKDVYTPGSIQITATNSSTQDVQVFKFNNVDSLDLTTLGDEAAEVKKTIFDTLVEKIKKANYETITATETSIDVKLEEIDYNSVTDSKLKELEFVYNIINNLKYSLETTEGLVVVKDETGTDNKDLNIKVYKTVSSSSSSTETEDVFMFELNLQDVANLELDRIIDIPALKDTDFATLDWAKDEIVQAMLNGVVVADKNFRPKDSITRAEFAKIIAESFGFEDTRAREPFSDVEEGDWYYEYVSALYNNGIIDGYEDGTFRPKESITRAEASKIMANAFAVNKGIIPLKETIEGSKVVLKSNKEHTLDVDVVVKEGENRIHLDSVTKFADDAEIKSWADGAVSNLVELGVINGYEDNTFKPSNEITRAEAVVMLMRLNNNN